MRVIKHPDEKILLIVGDACMESCCVLPECCNSNGAHSMLFQLIQAYFGGMMAKSVDAPPAPMTEDRKREVAKILLKEVLGVEDVGQDQNQEQSGAPVVGSGDSADDGQVDRPQG